MKITQCDNVKFDRKECEGVWFMLKYGWVVLKTLLTVL